MQETGKTKSDFNADEMSQYIRPDDPCAIGWSEDGTMISKPAELPWSPNEYDGSEDEEL